MTALALALALVCAWNRADCSPRQVGQGNLTNVLPSRNLQAVWRPDRSIVVSSKLQHPVAIGAMLAHELHEQAAGPPPGGHDCGDYEKAAVAAQGDFARWFVNSFGYPNDATGEDAFIISATLTTPGWFITC